MVVADSTKAARRPGLAGCQVPQIAAAARGASAT